MSDDSLKKMGTGIAIGVVLVFVLLLLGARILKINLFGIEFGISTETPFELTRLASSELGIQQTAVALQQTQIAINMQMTQIANSQNPTSQPQATADWGVQIPTQTPKPIVIATGISPVSLSCLSTPYSFLGDGWSSAVTFLPTEAGATKIFTHCPPMTTIQYNSIAVDDEIAKVEMVCSDSTADITSQFTPFKAENNTLLHWRSSRIELRQNCRIDFTIQDRQGVNIGLTIKESEP